MVHTVQRQDGDHPREQLIHLLEERFCSLLRHASIPYKNKAFGKKTICFYREVEVCTLRVSSLYTSRLSGLFLCSFSRLFVRLFDCLFLCFSVRKACRTGMLLAMHEKKTPRQLEIEEVLEDVSPCCLDNMNRIYPQWHHKSKQY